MTTLKLALLGTFQAKIGERPLTNFRSDKVRALLIYLMVEADRPHRREILAGLLWPDYTQKAALTNLRKSLFLLRKTIDDVQPGLSDEIFTITRQTVQVNPTKSVVDLFQFNNQLDAVKKHRHQHLHTCDACLETLFEAAEIYQGEFVAGFSLADASTFDSWLVIQRETLSQEILFVLEHLTASFELHGDFQQAKTFAKRQISLEPWREKAHRQLMRVLILDGRRSQALAQYESCKSILWEELGVKPAAETQLLYQKIKTGLLVSKETKARSHLHDFPTQFTAFIGRESELTQIVEQLTQADCRLLTLVGPGGIGKTRLSIEAAYRLADKGHFEGGIYFVPLTAIDEAEHFLLALAGQLEISIFGRSHIRQHLLNYLAEQEILLVLDNFEQLAAESGLLAELLQAAPGLKILVSSREALNIRAEQRLLLGGMETESAVSLFLQAAKKNWPNYKAAEHDLETIQEICKLVGGIPLAVEISAAWVKMMDVKTIAGQINQNVDFLQTQWQDVPERHRSMRAIFEESWKLLKPAEQRALAQFSIFKGGFSLNAIIAITSITVNEIAALLDKSLLEHPGKSRYKLHELLRQFAQVKLEERSSESDKTALQLNFSTYYLALVQRNETLLFGAAPQFGMADIESEIENIRQAWQWAVDLDQLELLSTGLDGLKMYYRLSGRYEEGAIFFSSIIDPIAAGADDPERSKLVSRLVITTADFAIQSSQFNEILENLQVALEESIQNDWPDCKAVAERVLGDYFNKQGDYNQAISFLKKSISYHETVDDRIDLIEGYYKLGIVYWRVEQWDNTKQTLAQALNLAQEIAYNWAVVLILMALGAVYRKVGEYDTALEHYERGIQLALDISYMPGVSRGYANSGLIYEDKGDYEKAIETYQRALEHDQAAGDKLRLAVDDGSIARVFWKLNRLEEALTLINETIPVVRSLGFKIHLAWQLVVKAEILYALGRYQEAWQVNEEGLKLSEETTLSQRVLQSQILAARLEIALGQPEAARQRLHGMISDEPDVFTLAPVHDELWKMTGQNTHAQQALDYYQQTYLLDPFIEYKERIEVLSEMLLDD